MNTINSYRGSHNPSFGIARFKGNWNEKIQQLVTRTDLYKQCTAENDVVNITFSQKIAPNNYSKAVKFVKERAGILGTGRVIAKAEGKGSTTEAALTSLIRWLAGM